MFDIKKLKNITLDDKEILNPFLTALDESSCEMSFANLAMWHTAYGTQYAFDDEKKLILYSPVERMIYFPRSGISPEELAELNDIFSAAGMTDNIIYDIPEQYIVENPQIYDFFDVVQNEDNFDYLYDNQHLKDCTGSKLRKKRNLIKQFLDLYPSYQLIPLEAASKERFLSLALRLNSLLEPDDFINNENLVMQFACDNFDKLGLSGIILNNGTEDAGFSIWSKLNDSIADIHFEKALHHIKGAAQFLTQQTAAVLHSQNIKYMNREQDLGSEGIRRAKRSLDPVFLNRRCSLIRKNRLSNALSACDQN